MFNSIKNVAINGRLRATPSAIAYWTNKTPSLPFHHANIAIHQEIAVPRKLAAWGDHYLQDPGETHWKVEFDSETAMFRITKSGNRRQSIRVRQYSGCWAKIEIVVTPDRTDLFKTTTGVYYIETFTTDSEGIIFK